MMQSQGALKTSSQTSYLQRGTSPLNIWYTSAQNQATLTTANGYSLNNMYASPFLLGRPAMLAKLSFEVTAGGGAGSRARVGIYAATSLSNTNPSKLVVDGGDYDTTSTGVKTTSGLAIFMPAGLYWLAYVSAVSAPTVRVVQPAGANGLLGRYAVDLNTNLTTLSIGLTYGALPAAYPGSGSTNSSGGVAAALEFA